MRPAPTLRSGVTPASQMDEDLVVESPFGDEFDVLNAKMPSALPPLPHKRESVRPQAAPQNPENGKSRLSDRVVQTPRPAPTDLRIFRSQSPLMLSRCHIGGSLEMVPCDPRRPSGERGDCSAAKGSCNFARRGSGSREITKSPNDGAIPVCAHILRFRTVASTRIGRRVGGTWTGSRRASFSSTRASTACRAARPTRRE